jgi:UrcA family protein
MEIEMPRSLSLLCAAAALAFTAAAPVSAQDYESEVVRFGDPDHDSERGAEALIERLQNASERVCGVRSGPQPVAQRVYQRDCALETTEYAVRDVGHPMVLAEYYGVYPRVIVEEGSADPYWDDGYVTVTKKPVK